MEPDNASVARTLVGINRVVAFVFAGDGALVLLCGLLCQDRVRCDDPRVPFVLQMIAAIGSDFLADNSGGAFRLVIIVGVAVINVPIAATRQVQRDVREETCPA